MGHDNKIKRKPFFYFLTIMACVVCQPTINFVCVGRTQSGFRNSNQVLESEE
jgi:hypothetical protein